MNKKSTKNISKTDMISDNQIVYVSKNQYLDGVVTLKEASILLGISDGYLRKKVLKGEFKYWEYRKTDKVILFYKDSILKRVKNSVKEG